MALQPTDQRERVLLALAKLRVASCSDLDFDAAVHNVVAIGTAPTPTADPFGIVGRAATKAEILRLASAAEALAAAIEALHNPAHNVLHQQSLTTTDFGVPKRLRAGAEHIRRANLSAVPERAGRGTEMAVRRSRALARALAHGFRRVTGKKPTLTVRNEMTSGPFLNIVSEVFSIFDIRESAEAAAREAIRTFPDKPGSVEEVERPQNHEVTPVTTVIDRPDPDWAARINAANQIGWNAVKLDQPPDRQPALAPGEVVIRRLRKVMGYRFAVAPDGDWFLVRARWRKSRRLKRQ